MLPISYRIVRSRYGSLPMEEGLTVLIKTKESLSGTSALIQLLIMKIATYGSFMKIVKETYGPLRFLTVDCTS